MQNDRPYMRGSGMNIRPGQFSMLTWLIIINIAVFILQNLTEVWFGSRVMSHYGALSIVNLLHGYVWTLVTYSFLHASLLHILFNMLILFFVGRIVQQQFGEKRLLQLYLVSAILGGLFWLAMNMGRSDLLLGASAAGFGILIYFCLQYPNQQITVLLFFVIPVTIKPKWLAWGLLCLELFSFFFYELPGKTVMASSAHLGGMLGGFLIFRLTGSTFAHFKRKGTNPKLKEWIKKSSPHKVADVKFKLNVKDRDHVRAEVDRILDKINSVGFGALTADEKKTLDDAKEWLNNKP
ncbi:MAG: hypothetical protein COZ46_04005 [Verrucomicrobia bacterium CG_4_10_14_3_um_filter_43_23]|nr:MAG: hypothetical protein COX01_01410 [Verrucomicrobia bacterium CG22_combo_CG10-13_8_21_14_all_43_17]PIX58433.1 MAG: hypothetical protein COZ46_04005 [Verrucomicrobia bacterium CG_4_10_14_3_um_filter_43_23]PIY61580.1 MAG: hypothetical protein COY94_04720 [Verrucomicrobia bacterium CG_4_10_14_0_8_um_filter_43_34]PJA44007.1 MAG: hypothetical protein CO175_05175 [Verrucomicrobia bacterium CG_4_9_14_3_um_filter_43_20]